MKKPYIILIIVIAITLVALFIERPDKNIGDFAPFTIFQEITSDDISKVEVKHLISGSVIEKSGDEWKVLGVETEMGRQLSDKEGKEVTEKPKYKADAERAKNVIEKLGKLKATSLISTNPEKQNTYQVGQLSKHVKLYNSAGKVVADIHIGKNGPDMFSTYVRREGENEVYLVSEHIGAVIPADVMSWRDKKIWNVMPDLVSGFSVKRPGKNESFSVVKNGEGKWQLSSPEESGLDSSKVEDLVKKISKVDANRFALVMENSETGFDKPSLELKISTTDGANYKLLVGKEDKQGYLYARLESGDNQVYLLNSNFNQKIPSDWKNLALNLKKKGK